MGNVSRANEFDFPISDTSKTQVAEPEKIGFTDDPWKHISQTITDVGSLNASPGQYAEAAAIAAGVVAVGLIARKTLPELIDSIKGGSKIAAPELSQSSKFSEAGDQLLRQSREFGLAGDTTSAETHFVKGAQEYGKHYVMKHYPGINEQDAAPILSKLQAYPASMKDAFKSDFWNDTQEGIIRVSSQLDRISDPIDRAAALAFRSHQYGEIGRNERALSDVSGAMDLYKRAGVEQPYLLNNRAWLHRAMGNDQAADADLIESGKMYARNHASRGGVPDAAQFVESNLAYPAIAKIAGHESTGEAQRLVIRESLRLPRMADGFDKASVLADRAEAYLQLGHLDAARRDLLSSRAMIPLEMGAH